MNIRPNPRADAQGRLETRGLGHAERGPLSTPLPVTGDGFTLSQASTSRKYSDGICLDAGARWARGGRAGDFQPPVNVSERVRGGSS